MNRILLLAGIIIFICNNAQSQLERRFEIGTYYVYKQHTNFLSPNGNLAKVREHFMNVNLGYVWNDRYKVGLEYVSTFVMCDECEVRPYSLIGMNMNYILIKASRVQFGCRAGLSVSNLLLKGYDLPGRAWGVNGVLGGHLELALTEKLGIQVGYYMHKPFTFKSGYRSLTQPVIGIVYSFSVGRSDVESQGD